MNNNFNDYELYLKAKRYMKGVGVLLFIVGTYIIGRMYISELIDQLVQTLGRH